MNIAELKKLAGIGEQNRQQQSEVLGYKLTGKSDMKSKPNKLTQQVGFKKNN